MSRENKLLAAAIQDRDAFDRVADHVDHADLSEQGWVLWEGVCSYYDADGGARNCDAGILGELIARKVPADKHKELFRNLATSLAEMEVSAPNVVADLLATKREVAGRELAAAIHGADELSVRKLYDRFGELLDAEDLEEEKEDVRRGVSVSSLVTEAFDPAGLIQVAPTSLNTRLKGGVKPGHHIVLFARPEMGKTMMTIEMMAGFARQGLDVLYIGNEDPIDDITMRVVNRLSGMTKEQVMEDPELADQLAREAGYEHLILVPLAPGTPREITKLLEEYKPQVLVLDQLRNLNMHQDNYVLALENAAKQARTWAKRYSCVVVSVTQAGDSASGKAVLDLGDVDYSNTGIPAQADLMVGLGANQQHKQAGEIVLSLPKNKISGTHEFFACQVEPEFSRVLPLV